MYTEKFTETHDVLAAIAPTAANGALGAHNTGYVSIADYHRVFAMLHVGEPAQGATLDLAVTQATDAAGTGAKVLTTAKAITQIAAADAGVYVGVEIRSEELDVTGGFVFLNVLVTAGTGTYTYSMVLFGIVSRYEPVGVTDWQEIVE